MTYENYAALRRWKLETIPQEDRLLKGVKVDYQAKVSGVAANEFSHTHDAAQVRFRSTGQVGR